MLRLSPFCGEGTWHLGRLSDWQGHILAPKSRGDNLSLLVQHVQGMVQKHTLRRQLWLWIPALMPTSCLTWNKYGSLLGFSFLIWKTGGDNDNLTKRSIHHQMVNLVCYPVWQRSSSHKQDFSFFFFNLNLNFFSMLYSTNRINRSGSQFKKLILSTLTFPTVIYTLLPAAIFVLPQNYCQDYMRIEIAHKSDMQTFNKCKSLLHLLPLP